MTDRTMILQRPCTPPASGEIEAALRRNRRNFVVRGFHSVLHFFRDGFAPVGELLTRPCVCGPTPDSPNLSPTRIVSPPTGAISPLGLNTPRRRSEIPELPQSLPDLTRC